MTPDAGQWRKSSRSGQQTSCVELARIGAGAVRDSKNPTGPMLSVNMNALLDAVKAGRVSC